VKQMNTILRRENKIHHTKLNICIVDDTKVDIDWMCTRSKLTIQPETNEYHTKTGKQYIPHQGNKVAYRQIWIYLSVRNIYSSKYVALMTPKWTLIGYALDRTKLTLQPETNEHRTKTKNKIHRTKLHIFVGLMTPKLTLIKSALDQN
jgi:hypothetical protein